MDLISLTAFIHWIYLQVYTTFTQFHSQDSQHQSSSLMIRLFCNSSFFHEFFLLLDISWFVEVIQTLNVIRLEVASFICCFISDERSENFSNSTMCLLTVYSTKRWLETKIMSSLRNSREPYLERSFRDAVWFVQFVNRQQLLIDRSFLLVLFFFFHFIY